MKRCAICEKAECVCGMHLWEDDDQPVTAAPPVPAPTQAEYQPAPMVRVPDTAGDRIAPVAIGVMVGFLIGFTLGVIAVASGR